MTAIRRRNTDRHSDERAMAATGGGKIRSRRYHIASKPYAKNKQVNRVKVFVLKTRNEDFEVIAVSLWLNACYCFVGGILWPAVSARGLHALLACRGNASKLAYRLAYSDGLDRSNHGTVSRLYHLICVVK